MKPLFLHLAKNAPESLLLTLAPKKVSLTKTRGWVTTTNLPLSSLSRFVSLRSTTISTLGSMMFNRYSFFCLLYLVCTASAAQADLKINADSLREYQLPGTFNIAAATVIVGANNATLLVSTIGASPETSACAVVSATSEGATLFEYKFNNKPTRCLGVVAHPEGGFFLRGDNPIATEGLVSGFTTFLSEKGDEVWAIPDQRLVDAEEEPVGSGRFLGNYEQPLPVMAYSPKLDRLIAFTVGRLDIGPEQKYISQAHVINVQTGQFQVSGQTFGQSGVGITGGVSVRNSDGNFIIFYYSSETKGAFFYSYDGRQEINFFKPRGEDWSERSILRMDYRDELLHLLWTPTEDQESDTRLTITNDTSAELWTAIFEPEYQFSTGLDVNLGRARSMWIGKNETIVLYEANSFFLRHVDPNGSSFGVATLEGLTPVPPVALLVTNDGTFKLLAYDQTTRYISEFALSFEDKPDYDPEVGPQLHGDVGIQVDVGFSDVLEATGCCATASARRTPSTFLFFFVGLIFTIHLRRRFD